MALHKYAIEAKYNSFSSIEFFIRTFETMSAQDFINEGWPDDIEFTDFTKEMLDQLREIKNLIDQLPKSAD